LQGLEVRKERGAINGKRKKRIRRLVGPPIKERRIQRKNKKYKKKRECNEKVPNRENRTRWKENFARKGELTHTKKEEREKGKKKV